MNPIESARGIAVVTLLGWAAATDAKDLQIRDAPLWLLVCVGFLAIAAYEILIPLRSPIDVWTLIWTVAAVAFAIGVRKTSSAGAGDAKLILALVVAWPTRVWRVPGFVLIAAVGLAATLVLWTIARTKWGGRVPVAPGFFVGAVVTLGIAATMP